MCGTKFIEACNCKNILQLWNPHCSQIFSEIDEFKTCFIPCLVCFCGFSLWLQSRHVYEPQEPTVLATLPTKGHWESYKGAITTEMTLSGLGDSASQQVSGTQCQLGPQLFCDATGYWVMKIMFSLVYYRKVWVISRGRLPLTWFSKQAYKDHFWLITSVCSFYKANTDFFWQGLLTSSCKCSKAITVSWLGIKVSTIVWLAIAPGS